MEIVVHQVERVLVLVTERDGQICPPSKRGLFFRDTRGRDLVRQRSPAPRLFSQRARSQRTFQSPARPFNKLSGC